MVLLNSESMLRPVDVLLAIVDKLFVVTNSSDVSVAIPGMVVIGLAVEVISTVELGDKVYARLEVGPDSSLVRIDEASVLSSRPVLVIPAVDLACVVSDVSM